MKIKEIAKNFTLILLSLFFTILIAEVLVRVFWAAPKFDFPQTQHRPHDILGWEMVPNQASFTWGVPALINSHGLRDDEFLKKKPKNVKRIVVLGDSVTFGVLVKGEETYPNQLEKLLNERHSDDKFEVINTGVQRYFTYQELDYLKLRGLEFEPDVVILGFYINDLGIRKKTWDREYENERELMMNKVREYIPFVVRILKNSALISLIRDRYLRLQSATAETSNPQQKLLAGINDEKMAKLWNAAREHIAELKELGQKHHFTLLIAAIPGVNQIVGDFPDSSYPATLEAIAKEMDIHYIDVLPVLKESYTGDIRSLHFPYDGHPNARAHRLIAESIYEGLLKLPLTPSQKADAID